MSSIMDWVKSTMGMSEEDEGIANDSFEQPVVPSRRKTISEDMPLKDGTRKSKVVNINTTAQLKVVIVQPLSYNDAAEIADHLKAKKPVVVNLEKVEKAVAVKIVDFLTGAVFALDGNMQKVSNGILLVVPNTMGIMGDFSDELKTQGLFDFF